MTLLRIVYPRGDGIAVMQVVDDGGLEIKEFAKTQVPAGLPFRVISVADLPAADDQRDAWRVDVQDLTDGVGERVEEGLGS